MSGASAHWRPELSVRFLFSGVCCHGRRKTEKNGAISKIEKNVSNRNKIDRRETKQTGIESEQANNEKKRTEKTSEKEEVFLFVLPLDKNMAGGGMLLFEWFDLTGLDKTQHGVKIFLRNIKI